MYLNIFVHIYSVPVYFLCFYRGINFVLSALVFNVFPTLFEVSLVTAILVGDQELPN